MLLRLSLVSVLAVSLWGCTLKEEKAADIPAPPDVAAVPADAHKTASGLASKVLQVGMSNIRPSIRSNVKVHYTGWTTDGRMFDSSIGRDPLTFQLQPGALIDGWIEGLQLMVVGEKRRFWIPGDLAYDKIPDSPGAPPHPKGMLVFDIELLSVN